MYPGSLLSIGFGLGWLVKSSDQWALGVGFIVGGVISFIITWLWRCWQNHPDHYRGW
jgi:hypothetical protein